MADLWTPDWTALILVSDFGHNWSKHQPFHRPQDWRQQLHCPRLGGHWELLHPQVRERWDMRNYNIPPWWRSVSGRFDKKEIYIYIYMHIATHLMSGQKCDVLDLFQLASLLCLGHCPYWTINSENYYLRLVRKLYNAVHGNTLWMVKVATDGRSNL